MVFCVNTGTLEHFHAESDPGSDRLFSLVEVRNFVIEVYKNTENQTFEISVAGILEMPDSMPDELAEQEVVIESFTVNTNGEILDFHAGIVMPGDTELFDGLYARDIELDAMLLEDTLCFGVSGSVFLDNSFPGVLSGLSGTINTLVFSIDGRLEDVDAEITIPDGELIGSTRIEGGTLRLFKGQTRNTLIDISGTVVLPENFPQGIAGTEIVIRELVFNTAGQIHSMDIGAENIETDLFNTVALTEGSIAFRASQNTDIIIDIAGTLTMPETLPGDLSGLEINIDTFRISSSGGIDRFSASVASSLSVPAFAGIETTITSLGVSEAGVSMAGTFTFPGYFPEGLAGNSFLLDNLAVTWAGEVSDFAGGVEHINGSFHGFPVEIRNVRLSRNGVFADEFSLALPESLGTGGLSLTDIAYDTQGNFSCEITVSDISVNAAGCTVTLRGIGFDDASGAVTCETARLVLPESAGGVSAEMRDVSISSDGLEVGGGRIDVPDFSIAGGIGFSDVYLEFESKDDNGTRFYRFAGGGQAFIQGVGTMGAQIAIRPIDTTYPWGIEYAIFEFELDTLGIPVPGTGLFINGFKGGIAFGPPGEETPEPLRYIASGTRLMVGLSMRDALNTTTADPEVWINLDNWDWGIYGDFTFLSGLIKAQTSAVLTESYGFEAQLRIQIVFLRGHARIHIFEHNNEAMLCGSVEAEVLIEQGALFIWPGDDIWLGPLGTQFGNFNQDRVGFKLYFRAGALGEFGLFIGTNGEFTFGGVSDIVLFDQTDEYLAQVKGSSKNSISEHSKNGTSKQSSDEVDTLGGFQSYRFFVPVNTEGRTDQERLIITLEYSAGDPVVTMRGPDGIYSEGDENVSVMRTELGMAFVLQDPAPGRWDLDVRGFPSREYYEIRAMGVYPAPQIIVERPDSPIRPDNRPIRISGSIVDSSGSENREIRVFRSSTPESSDGVFITSELVRESEFSLDIPSNEFPEGIHYLFLEYHNNTHPEIVSQIEHPIIVETTANDLQAIRDAEVAVTETGNFQIRFTGRNGNRAAGFQVQIQDTELEETSLLNIGLQRNTVIPGTDNPETSRIRLRPVDTQGRPGPWSRWFFPSNRGNVEFSAGMETPEIELEIGEVREAVITITAEDLPQLFCVAPETEQGIFLETQDVFEITEDNVSIIIPVHVNSDIQSGEYTVALDVYPFTNQTEKEQLRFTIAVQDPQIDIAEAEYQSMNGEHRLSVTGSGFLPETRAFLNNREVPVSLHSLTQGTIELETDPSPGSHTLSLQSGEEGNTDSYTLLISSSSYEISLFPQTPVFPVNTNGEIHFYIHPDSGFSGPAEFTLETEQEGNLRLATTEVTESGRGILSVHTGGDTESIRGTLVSSSGSRVPIEIQVTQDPQEPYIERMHPFPCMVNRELTFYGGGLEETDRVLLSGEELDIVNSGYCSVTVLLPEEADTGRVRLYSGNQEIASSVLIVQRNGFQLYPVSRSIAMEPGESAEIGYLIQGWPGDVSITPGASEPGITLTPEPALIVPNRSGAVIVNWPEDVDCRSFEVSITAQGGGFHTSETVQILRRAQLEITAPDSLFCTEESFYHYEIPVENATEEPVFSIVSGRLPRGISLTSSGRISGIPTQPGSFRFTVRAASDEDTPSEKTLTMHVEENSWPVYGQNSGMSFQHSTVLPANKAVLWETGAVSGGMLVSNGRTVYSAGAEGIAALSAATGEVLWRSSTAVSNCVASASTFIAQTPEGRTVAYHPEHGNMLWEREDGGELLRIDPRTAAIAGDASVKLIEMQSGALQRSIETIPNADYLVLGSMLFRYSDNRLEAESSGGWIELITCETAITQAYTSGRNIIINTEGGVFRYNTETGLFTEEETEEDTRLFFTQEHRIAADTRELRMTASATGEEIWRYSVSCGYSTEPGTAGFIHCPEKIAILTSEGIQIISTITGRLLWEQSGSFTGIISTGGDLFAINTTGVITAFSGSSDPNPPETILRISDNSEANQFGYFTETLRVLLTAREQEALVEETFFKINQEDWQEYSEPIPFEDGLWSLGYYSTDTNGNREEVNSEYLMIDTVAPEAEETYSFTELDNSWYGSTVTLELSYLDEGSGILDADIRIDGSLQLSSTEAECTTEGIHEFTWQVRDNAGNTTQGSRSFSIDLYPPVLDYEVDLQPAGAEVTLTSSDTGSGTAYIEYRLSGSSTREYETPVFVPGMQGSAIDARAVDNAGRTSAWQRIEIPERRYGTVRTFVQDNSGRGVPGVRVYVQNTYRRHLLGVTDTRGFLTQEAAVNSYTLIVEKNHTTSERAIEVYPRETEEYRFSMGTVEFSGFQGASIFTNTGDRLSTNGETRVFPGPLTVRTTFANEEVPIECEILETTTRLELVRIEGENNRGEPLEDLNISGTTGGGLWYGDENTPFLLRENNAEIQDLDITLGNLEFHTEPGEPEGHILVIRAKAVEVHPGEFPGNLELLQNGWQELGMLEDSAITLELLPGTYQFRLSTEAGIDQRSVEITVEDLEERELCILDYSEPAENRVFSVTNLEGCWEAENSFTEGMVLYRQRADTAVNIPGFLEGSRMIRLNAEAEEAGFDISKDAIVYLAWDRSQDLPEAFQSWERMPACIDTQHRHRAFRLYRLRTESGRCSIASSELIHTGLAPFILVQEDTDEAVPEYERIFEMTEDNGWTPSVAYDNRAVFSEESQSIEVFAQGQIALESRELEDFYSGTEGLEFVLELTIPEDIPEYHYLGRAAIRISSPSAAVFSRRIESVNLNREPRGERLQFTIEVPEEITAQLAYSENDIFLELECNLNSRSQPYIIHRAQLRIAPGSQEILQNTGTPEGNQETEEAEEAEEAEENSMY